MRHGLVGGIWEFRNDVPGVKEARDEAQTAEKDIDERVSGTKATLDPYYEMLGVCTRR